MRDEHTPLIRLADYRPPDYLVDSVDLTVRLHPVRTDVIARLSVRTAGHADRNGQLVLDGEDLTLTRVALDGTELSPNQYEATAARLTIGSPPEGRFTLEIETEINPSANTRLMGLYLSGGNYCTQCEADGFRRITYFLDRPDVMSVYRLRLEAARADAPVLLGNGNLVEAGDIPGTDRHYAVWHDPFPKPCYLFALVGGRLGSIHDRFVTMSGREVSLGIYTEVGKEPFAAYAMDALKRSMRWDEEVFGREYDLDVFNIVAVSDFNMGAMENKGLNIFNDKYVLASPGTATDTDYAMIEGIIAHEYFHNWTGNRITCRDWFQLCLKEGLTVYRDQEFSADMRSRPVKRIADVRELRARQFPEDAGPLAHPVRPRAYREINNFYTATVYEKGAEIVRMLRILIGENAFRTGMDLYFSRHDGEAATVEQFLACFSEASGKSLDRFALWYEQAGTPHLKVVREYDSAAHRLTLKVSQSTAPTPGQPVKEPLVIPIRAGLVSDAGDARPERLVILDGPATEIVFDGVDADVTPSLLRGFSAPVQIDSAPSETDLRRLASCDSDPFNRWQALQTLGVQSLTRSVEAVRSGLPVRPSAALADAMAALLEDADADPAFAAMAMALPGELDLAREIGDNIDPDAIHIARLAQRRASGLRCLVTLRGIRSRLPSDGPYVPDAAGTGRRALRNSALDYLASADHDAGRAEAEAQFATANNMTDRMAALATLVHTIRGEAGERALARFEGEFADMPLVMDKWFALQATMAGNEALDRVRALMLHRSYSHANPNRVRALIGSFAAGNPTGFNRADGEGFEFVAEQILDLDRRNPQVAARLMTAFRSWRTLEPVRRARARDTLERIARRQDLSRDVRDIVDRTLAG
jgi:aminopeptidase N